MTCHHLNSAPSTRNRKFSKTETFFSEYITEVFKYDDVIPSFKARSSAHTIRKRYVWTQIFFNTEKHLRFRKYPGYVWMVKYGSKTLHVGADFFLNTEGKENTRLRVDEAFSLDVLRKLSPHS